MMNLLGRRSVSVLVIVAAVLNASSGVVWGADGPEDPDPGRFSKAIRAFEEADRATPPKPGGIVFVGSSSIRLWKLERSFPGLDAVNRGFGGSHLSDVIHYADRVILPHEPGVVVLYAGDNDVASGKSAERVHKDFRTLASLVWEHLPDTRIMFLAIKPSPSRSQFWPEAKRANELIAGDCDQDDRLDYVDVASPMLTKDGEFRPELFVGDQLHMNDAGYEIWAEVLEPRLQGEN